VNRKYISFENTIFVVDTSIKILGPTYDRLRALKKNERLRSIDRTLVRLLDFYDEMQEEFEEREEPETGEKGLLELLAEWFGSE